MAAQWYCLVGQREYGPFTGEQIQQLVQRGKLKREHHVRPETDPNWTPASDIPGLFTAPQVAGKRRKDAQPAVPVPLDSPTSTARPSTPPVAAIVYPSAPAPLAGAVAVAHVAPVPSAVPVAVPLAPLATPIAAQPVPIPRSAPGMPPVPAAPSGQRKTNPVAIPRKRHGQPLVLVGGLAGVLVILAGIAVFVLTRNPTKKNAPPRSKETVAAAQGVAATGGTAAEANPEADPVAAADETTEAEATPAGAPEASAPRGDLPDLKKWLMAPRGKGGFRDHSQVQVSKAWIETKDAGFALLNVEVEVTNLSPEEPLSFKPWTGEAGSSSGCEAIMADANGTRLKGVSARAGGGRSTAARRSIEPGEAYVHRLAFVVPKAGATSFRLALSYAAVGQTGYIGFEIPETMFQKEESKPAQPSTRPVEEPDTVVRESPTQPRTGEPDTIDDLRSTIEQAKPKPAEPGMDDMPKEQPADMEPEPAPPDSISDLRKSIEGEGGEEKDTNNDMKEP